MNKLLEQLGRHEKSDECGHISRFGIRLGPDTQIAGRLKPTESGALLPLHFQGIGFLPQKIASESRWVRHAHTALRQRSGFTSRRHDEESEKFSRREAAASRCRVFFKKDEFKGSPLLLAPVVCGSFERVFS
jgi:hypothetical protein